MDRQRVHVRPQRHRRAFACYEIGHDAGATDTGFHLEVELFESFGNDARGPVLLKRKLGVPVEVAPKLDQVRSEALRLVQKIQSLP